MSRPFPAQYRGRCYECPDPIEVGQEVVWAGDGTRMVTHAACAEPAASQQRPAGRMSHICSKCQLQHAGECF